MIVPVRRDPRRSPSVHLVEILALSWRMGRLVFVGARDERECACLFSPIPAFLFGLIESLIRCLDQIDGRTVPAGDRTGEAYADSSATTFRMRNTKGFNALPKRLRNLCRSIRPSTRKHDDEFVSSLAAHGVATPHDRGEPRRHLPQQLIAGIVPERVVDFLEIVQIDKEHRG